MKQEPHNGYGLLDPADSQPREVVPFTILFGDESGSHSEKYRLTITPVSGDTRPGWTMVNRAFGQPDPLTVRLAAGATYEVGLEHIATEPEFMREYGFPNCDWTLDIQTPQAGGFAVFVDDPDNIVTTVEDWPNSTFRAAGKTARITVVRAGLVPDRNRDREIGAAEASADAFRLWINDAADKNDVAEGESDLPGQSSGWRAKANFSDGRADLLDFFPVWLDLGQALAALPSGGRVTVKLRHDANALAYVQTGLTTNDAGSFLVSDVAGLASAETRRITGEGVNLPDAFVDSLRADPSKGIILIEGRAATSSPLVAEIWREGKKLVKMELPLKISSVEDFYRWLNLRGIAGGAVARYSSLGVPSGFPDAGSNGRHFVFVHGYNVSESQARAWNAEMFKRLWQSGSKAMFTAVTWYGNDSQAWWWLNNTPNYYANVEHAFASASALANAVNNSLPGVKVIAGHSLGNMLVSAAIADHGLGADAYFMLNAAVAQEAYDATALQRDEMRHPDWQGYGTRLWASDWYALFTAPDGRRGLTWRNRFGNIANAYNLYSSGEDVLNNGDGTLHAFLASEWSWANQEMRKGLWPLVVPGNNEAGWDFNHAHDVTVGHDPDTGAPILERMPPATANVLSDSVLQTNSFFRLFDDTALYGTNGGAVAQAPQARAQLLADAIPAVSRAMGRNPLTGFGGGAVDMNAMRNGWPQVRQDDDNLKNRWLHSDLKNVAYLFTYRVFDDIVHDKGELQ